MERGGVAHQKDTKTMSILLFWEVHRMIGTNRKKTRYVLWPRVHSTIQTKEMHTNTLKHKLFVVCLFVNVSRNY